jgi:hypothetical protein
VPEPETLGRFNGRGRSEEWVLTIVTSTVLGAVFDLNNPAHVLEWHFVKLAVANVVVIGLMLAVFALAIALPFPGASRRQAARRSGAGGSPAGAGEPR